MPAPGPGGSQSSLAGMVAWLKQLGRAKPPSQTGAAPAVRPGNIAQFDSTFQPGTLFSAGNPLVPTDRQNVRAWNYPTAWNINYTPRSYEAIGFEQLRSLAYGHDITRMCIETRKDQIAELQWVIKPLDTDDEPPATVEKRIATITKFLRKPDTRTPFATWIRELVEDVLVVDAPALEIRRNRGGDIIGLDYCDGATFKVLLDETGRRPTPPAPAYEQIIHGRPWALLEDGTRADDNEGKVGNDFTDGELIYLPRNPRGSKAYGFSPVEQIVTTINIGLRRQASQLLQFTAGNIPPGMLESPAGWSTQNIAEYQEWLDTAMSGNLAAKRKLFMGPPGAKYQPFIEAPIKDGFDEWLARVVCYAFSLPPTAFTPQVNRATAETAQETALAEGLAPLMGWVKRLMDLIVQDLMGDDDLEFAWIEKHEIDQAIQATMLIGYVKEGIYARNEARDILGMGPVDGGDDLMVDTATGPILLSDVAAISSLAANPPPLPAPVVSGSNSGSGGSPGGASPKGKKPNGGAAPAGNGKKPPAKKA